jgi:hypothetical protein
MSKGSGRRRTTPADGLKYDPETEMTTVEQRGSKAIESIKARGLYSDRAPPTKMKDYGSHSGTGYNGRYGGRGRKNDYRNWKNYTKGQQYDRPKPDGET